MLGGRDRGHRAHRNDRPCVRRGIDSSTNFFAHRGPYCPTFCSPDSGPDSCAYCGAYCGAHSRVHCSPDTGAK